MHPDETAHTAHNPARRASRLAGAAIGLGLFSAAMWFAWLGWDHEYYLVDGVEQGPYRTWQVIGCGLSIVVAAVIVYLWTRGLWSIFVLAAAGVIGFAVPWALDAAATDDSGLWVVGLVFLLVGGGLGLGAVLGVTAALASLRRPRPDDAPATS